MRYETVSKLSKTQFKRLVGVKRQTFNLMLRILEVAYAYLHQYGGKPDKLSLEDTDNWTHLKIVLKFACMLCETY
jgi:hypothetical protein